MSIGMLTSGQPYSTLKYTGAEITDRFSETTTNQELLKFQDKEGNDLTLNTITIEADTVDLYFTIWVKPKKSTKTIETHDFIDDAVYICPAGESRNISGLGAGGIKFSNDSGARYFIQGMSY